MRTCVSLYTSILIIGLFGGNVDGGVKLASSQCDKYFSKVSEIVGLAFGCFGEYSQPVAFCGQCVEIMEQLYDILNDSQTKTDYGQACCSFINSPSTQSPIRDILWKVVDTWQSGHCSSCLRERCQQVSHSKYRQAKRSISYSHPAAYKYSAYNNQTLELFSRLNDTLRCISPFIHNTTVSVLDPVNFPPLDKVSFDGSVCTVCKDAYRNLIELYKHHTSAEKEQELLVPPLLLCGDIGDALNRTHWVWQQMLNCTLKKPAVQPIVALIPLITCSLLLVLFHCCLLCCCHRPIHLIFYKPRRVEEISPDASLGRSNHNFQALHSTDNNEEMLRSLSVQFRQRKFDRQYRHFSYNTIQMSHADDNN